MSFYKLKLENEDYVVISNKLTANTSTLGLYREYEKFNKIVFDITIGTSIDDYNFHNQLYYMDLNDNNCIFWRILNGGNEFSSIIERTYSYLEELSSEIEYVDFAFDGKFFNLTFETCKEYGNLNISRRVELYTYFDAAIYADVSDPAYDSLSVGQFGKFEYVSDLLDFDPTLNFYIDKDCIDRMQNTKGYHFEIETKNLRFYFTQSTVEKMITREYLRSIKNLPIIQSDVYSFEDGDFFLLGSSDCEIRQAKILLFKIGVFSPDRVVFVKDIDPETKVIKIVRGKAYGNRAR